MDSNGIKIDPDQIKFITPFSDYCVSCFIMTNTSPIESMAFKIKAVQAKRYIVKPTNGILKPNEARTVTIELRPFPNQGVLSKFIATRQKFLIQSVVVPSESKLTAAEVFKTVKTKDIFEVKVPVVFEAHDDRLDKAASLQSVSETPTTSSMESVRNRDNSRSNSLGCILVLLALLIMFIAVCFAFKNELYKMWNNYSTNYVQPKIEKMKKQYFTSN
ncbi:hypothetical protein BLOT_008620 [Blomia tropicalis]|nr:hypothetical protein BLOT_008620 [Blomia tropicalis]